MLLHSRPRADVTNCTTKKSDQSELKNLPQKKILLQLHSNFQVFVIGLRAFPGGSITFLEITLAPN